MKDTRVSVNTFEGVNYHTKTFAPPASSSRLLPSQQFISLPHYNVVLDTHLVSERWLKSSEFHDGLQMHEHTHVHTYMHAHTHRHTPPHLHTQPESYQVIKTRAQPWSFVLARSLWLLSGWLFSPEYLCSRQSIHNRAPDYPTVGNCSSISLTAISLPLQIRKQFYVDDRGHQIHISFFNATHLFFIIFFPPEKLKYAGQNLLYQCNCFRL